VIVADDDDVVVAVHAAHDVVAPEKVSIFRFFTFLMSIFTLTSQSFKLIIFL
jgi:hypothetical protein